MSCILRIGGKDFKVDEYLKTTGFAAIRIYRRGDRARSTESGVQEESGCNIDVSIADFDEFERQKVEALKFLTDHFDKVRLFRTYGGESAEIDFGIRSKFVQEDIFSHTDFLPPELILICGKLRIGIALSHYWATAENQPGPGKED